MFADLDAGLLAIYAVLSAPAVIGVVALIVLACVLAHYADRAADRAAERVWPTPRVLRGGK